MRAAALVLVAAALAGCGAHKVKVVDAAPFHPPAYPGATNRQVTDNGAFTTVDFTLPARATAAKVYAWYVSYLTHHGWKVTDRNDTGPHAEKGEHTIDVGVRGTTLEENLG